MSEEIPNRAKSDMEEITFIDPAADAQDHIAQEPLTMDMVQQILDNINTRMANNHAQIADGLAEQSQQIASLTQILSRLPDLVKNEGREQQRSEPVGDFEALDSFRSELRVQGSIIRDFAHRI